MPTTPPRWLMLVLSLILAVAVAAAEDSPTLRAPVPPPGPPGRRTLFVPFDDLPVLLEGSQRRVLLPREEYEALLRREVVAPSEQPPLGAAIVAAEYDVAVSSERAEFTGTVTIDSLRDGPQAVELELSGVGVRAATLGGKPAPIAVAPSGRPVVVIHGKGIHRLGLDLVASVETTAAQQTLNFQVPAATATRLRLIAAGDIEVRSGAAVVSRRFDADANVTRVELLPHRGAVSLVMSLNSHLKRTDRVVVSRAVLIDEVTRAYERLHATFTMSVLHSPVDRFRFEVPEGFEVTDVASPRLARWAVEADGLRRVLDVRLREETAETVVIDIAATRTPAPLDNWELPRLLPLDTAGQVAVVGLLLEDRLEPAALEARGLVPIDNAAIAGVLPPSALEAQPGTPRVRVMSAYYAPRRAFSLAGRFIREPASLAVSTNVLLVLEDQGQRARGAFTLSPENEKLADFAFRVPAGWNVTRVSSGGAELPFERWDTPEGAGGAGRVRVRLGSSLAVGESRAVLFEAEATPPDWLAPWDTTGVAMPDFAVIGAASDTGAVAVHASDDLEVTPQTIEGLTPLDENEKAGFGLAGVATDLAYRYDAPPYAAALRVRRVAPRVTAQTYAFFRIEPDAVSAHYEIVYRVDRAKAHELAFSLPASAPEAVSVRGLGDAAVKDSGSVAAQGRRRWTVRLAEPRGGPVRLAIDFQQPLPVEGGGPSPSPAPGAGGAARDLLLPLVRAEGVAYQTGFVALEGSPELDAQPTNPPRRVDAGELVDAEYQPGRRLLGAYESPGDTDTFAVTLRRPAGYGLPPAIVQRLDLATVISARGLSQTAARFALRTKTALLELRLPTGARLWSATLDSAPLKPQRDGGSLLLSLPAGDASSRELEIVYESPTRPVGLRGHVDLTGPRLLSRTGGAGAAVEVPVADLHWDVYAPEDYAVIRGSGTVASGWLDRPDPAALAAGGWLLRLGGGVPGPFCLLPGLGGARRTANQMKSSTQLRGIHQSAEIYAQSNNNYMPPDLGTLVAQDLISGDMVVSPDSDVRLPEGFRTWSPADKARWVNDHSTYVFLRLGQQATDDSNLLAGFERPAPGRPGVSVVWDDNHAEYMQLDEARRVVEFQTGRTMEELMAGAKPLRAQPGRPGQVIVHDDSGATGATVLPNTHSLAHLKIPTPAVAAELQATPPPARPGAGFPPADRPAATQPAQQGRPAAPLMGLLGVRSLPIDLQRLGRVVSFTSLGEQPDMELTLINPRRLSFLSRGLGLAVAVVGLGLVARRPRTKLAFLLAVMLVTTVVPLVPASRSGLTRSTAASSPRRSCYRCTCSSRWCAGSAGNRRASPPLPSPAWRWRSCCSARVAPVLPRWRATSVPTPSRSSSRPSRSARPPTPPSCPTTPTPQHSRRPCWSRTSATSSSGTSPTPRTASTPFPRRSPSRSAAPPWKRRSTAARAWRSRARCRSMCTPTARSPCRCASATRCSNRRDSTAGRRRSPRGRWPRARRGRRVRRACSGGP